VLEAVVRVALRSGWLLSLAARLTLLLEPAIIISLAFAVLWCIARLLLRSDEEM